MVCFYSPSLLYMLTVTISIGLLFLIHVIIQEDAEDTRGTACQRQDIFDTGCKKEWYLFYED